MGRQQNGINPSVWNFFGSSGFTWQSLGAQILYVDTPVLGAQHNTGQATSVGSDNYNTIVEDLYNRAQYLYNQILAVGNRGYLKNVVKNSTTALTVADAGIITVKSAPEGTPPTTHVVLTLPSRAALVAAGVGYFGSISSPPYYNQLGSNITPFIINGYTAADGTPLQVTTDNPTTPGTLTPGCDFGQNIKVGTFQKTTVNLYADDYAEFIPVIYQDVANNYWHLTWVVNVHNSKYEKFVLGGGGSAVVVGTSGYPSTNYDKKGDFYKFSINNGSNLSWMPDNTAIGVYNTVNESATAASTASLVYVQMQVSSAGTYILKHNLGGAPTGYKPIHTPNGFDITGGDGDILVMLETQNYWEIVAISGFAACFDTVWKAINNETTNRTNADITLQSNINTEASTRATNDTTLQNNIDGVDDDLITEATTRGTADTTLQNNINALGVTINSATPTLASGGTLAGSGNTIQWVIIGKSMFLWYSFNATTLAFNSINMNLPASATAAVTGSSHAKIGNAAGYTNIVAGDNFIGIALIPASTLPSISTLYTGSAVIGIT